MLCRMGHRAALFALTFVLSCREAPTQAVQALMNSLSAGELDAVARGIAPDYADPLGDKAALLTELEALTREAGRLQLEPRELWVREGASRLQTTVLGQLTLELSGEPSWKVVGPLEVTVVSTDRARIASGLLVELRDVRALMASRRAALEANDAEALTTLLHPQYRDGDLDRSEASARLARDLEGVRLRLFPRHYRLELRDDLAHLDEHYVLEVNQQARAPAVARFTLRRSAGRFKLSAGLYPEGE